MWFLPNYMDLAKTKGPVTFPKEMPFSMPSTIAKEPVSQKGLRVWTLPKNFVKLGYIGHIWSQICNLHNNLALITIGPKTKISGNVTGPLLSI